MAARLSCALALLATLLVGCASCPKVASRPFAFGRDQLAFANELRWSYSPDGRITKKDPTPAYSLRCVPLARVAREFLYHARFDPALPVATPEEYRAIIRKIIARDSRCPAPPEEQIVLPGFANLAEFSQAHEAILKAEAGGASRSYIQRGNWRMIFPFSRRHQATTARDLKAKLAKGLVPIVHLVDFPRLKINHTLLLFEAAEKAGQTMFHAYDPNNPERAAELRFDPAERRFHFEKNAYFEGGPVNVYETFKSALL